MNLCVIFQIPISSRDNGKRKAMQAVWQVLRKQLGHVYITVFGHIGTHCFIISSLICFPYKGSQLDMELLPSHSRGEEGGGILVHNESLSDQHSNNKRLQVITSIKIKKRQQTSENVHFEVVNLPHTKRNVSLDFLVLVDVCFSDCRPKTMPCFSARAR